jgi:hypothetical protein
MKSFFTRINSLGEQNLSHNRSRPRCAAGCREAGRRERSLVNPNGRRATKLARQPVGPAGLCAHHGVAARSSSGAGSRSRRLGLRETAAGAAVDILETVSVVVA